MHAHAHRHEDLKGLLDSNKDPQKLDAMRLIVGVSDQFEIICLTILGNQRSKFNMYTIIHIHGIPT